jgi:hypothetical protein
MTPEPAGRADGTVKRTFEYGMFQSPVVDAADMSAGQSCGAWGQLQKCGGGRVG